MSAALDAILADIEAQLEVTVELDSAKRSDGTLKTWYYSSHGRSTGAAETPANTEFPAYLKPGGTLGPLSQSLAEDLLFSGMAENDPGSIILTQPLPESATDQLSQLNDYTFAGYGARIKIGRVADAYAAFELLRTTTCDVEPEVVLIEGEDGGLRAELRLAGALKRMLEENLIVNRYVGIPSCVHFLTSVGSISRAHDAVHSLTRFTAIARFKTSSTSAGVMAIFRKQASATNCNWSIRLLQTSGFISGLSSTATATDVSITGSVNYADGKWHVAVLARDNATTAYLMVDGVVIGSVTPTGTTDTPANAIEIGTYAGTDRYICDCRLYDRYIAPDEARGISSVRSDGDDLGSVALWRLDDNAGTTANDYSANNLDATINGTQNTDWKWDSTDLGEPELAGRPMPIVIGEVLNAQAHLIDGARERYRAAGAPLAELAVGTLAVRSRGTVLTGGGTDYTAPSFTADAIIPMVAQEDEPVTFDLRGDGTDNTRFFPSRIARRLLEDYTRIVTAGIRTDRVSALEHLCPWLSGFHAENDADALTALLEIFGGVALNYCEDETGDLYIDALLPPFGYGPYGEPCLDFRGTASGAGVTFGDMGDATSDLTMAAWFKTALSDQTEFAFSGTAAETGIISKGDQAIRFIGSGQFAGRLQFSIGGTNWNSAVGLVQPFVWYFVAAVFDNTANTFKLYLGAQGGTLGEVVSVTETGTPTTNAESMQVGYQLFTQPDSWCSVQHAQKWTATKTLGQLQTVMATPPVGNEANLVFYAPINEGSGSPAEKVGSGTGTLLSGARWAPKLVVNLNDTPSVLLTEFRHAAPAADVIVRYARNRHPMTPADIDTGVSQNNRLDLQREWKDVRLENPDNRTRFKNARRVELDSPITDRESAQRLARSLMARFGTDRYVGTLSFPPGLAISRQACGLQLGDEIGLIGAIPSQISTARSFRVVAVAPDPLQLSTTIAIWG